MKRLLYEINGYFEIPCDCWVWSSPQLPLWGCTEHGPYINYDYIQSSIVAHLLDLKRQGMQPPASTAEPERCKHREDYLGNQHRLMIVYWDVELDEDDENDLEFLASCDTDTLYAIMTQRTIEAQIANRRYSEACEMYLRKMHNRSYTKDVLISSALSERAQVAESYALRHAEPEVISACSLLSPSEALHVARLIDHDTRYGDLLPQYTYNVYFEHRAGTVGEYRAYFPDLPGCGTTGTSLDDARISATEALCKHLRAMWEDGLKFPTPSAMPDISEEEAHMRYVEAITVDIRDRESREGKS